MMRASGIYRAVATALAVLGCSGIAPAPAAPDPDAIFANVRRVWGTGAYARYAEYATVVEYHKNGKLLKNTWDTVEDLRRSAIYSRKFSREEAARPSFPPGGFNIAVPFLGNINKPQPNDPIGHVAFAIDQDYGMAPAAPHFRTAPSARDLNAEASKLQVIGRTRTIARDYEIRLIETLVDENGPEYHLALRPLHDPERYRLRELYVDGTTWAPEEAVVDGIGNRPPLTKVQWRIEYRQVDGATYIARETALTDVDFGKAGLLQWVTITFAELKLNSKRTGLGAFGLGVSDDDPLREPGS